MLMLMPLVASRPMTFASCLHALLEKKGWSVNELARQSGVPYPTLKSYFQTNKKTGRSRLPTYANVVAICKALEVSTDYFTECVDWSR